MNGVTVHAPPYMPRRDYVSIRLTRRLSRRLLSFRRFDTTRARIVPVLDRSVGRRGVELVWGDPTRTRISCNVEIVGPLFSGTSTGKKRYFGRVKRRSTENSYVRAFTGSAATFNQFHPTFARTTGPLPTRQLWRTNGRARRHCTACTWSARGRSVYRGHTVVSS